MEGETENADVVDVVEMETPGEKPKEPVKKTHCHIFGEAHIRSFAWFFMILSQIGTIMFTMCKIYSTSKGSSSLASLDTAGMVFSFFQFCFMPLALTANFSGILRNQESFVPALLQYGGGTLGIFIVYLFVYFRYIVKLIVRITGKTVAEACEISDMVLSMLFDYLRQLNFFVDLFVCTLIAFFILYRPKKFFVGKTKLRIFRMMVAIPILWSIIGYILLGLNAEGAVLPAYIYPLIPLKPPMFLVVFVLLVAYIKLKQKFFFAKGHTEEEYKDYFLGPEFVQSFANFTSLSLVLASVFDFGILFVRTPAMTRMGFGQSCLLWVVIPIIFFYDFTKNIKNPMIGFLIPVIAVVIIVIMWIETVYWIAAYGIDYLKPFLGMLFGDDSEEEGGAFN